MIFLKYFLFGLFSDHFSPSYTLPLFIIKVRYKMREIPPKNALYSVLPKK